MINGKDGNDNEELNQNQLSERFNSLTENNTKIKSNEILFHNFSKDQESEKRNSNGNKEINDNMNNKNNLEDIKEYSNISLTNEDKKLEDKKENINYINDYEENNIQETPKKLYLNENKEKVIENDINKNFKELENNENNNNINVEYKFNYEIKDISRENKYDLNKKENKTQYYSFYEKKRKDNYKSKNNTNNDDNDDNNIKKNKEHNIEANNNENSNDESNENNNNDIITYEIDYDNNENKLENNIEINNNNSYINNKINYIKEEENDKKEKKEIEKNIEKEEKKLTSIYRNNEEEKGMIKVNRIQYSNKNESEKQRNEKEKEINIYQTKKNPNNEIALEDDEIIDRNNYYYFNYDYSANIRNYYPKKTGQTDYSTEPYSKNKIHKDSKNSEIKEFKEIKSNTIESNNDLLEQKDFKQDKFYINNNKNNDNFDINIKNDENSDSYNYKNYKAKKYINNINNVEILNKHENKNILSKKNNEEENKDINLNDFKEKEAEDNNNIFNNVKYNDIHNDYKNYLNNFNEEILNKFENKNIIEESDNNLRTKNYIESNNNNYNNISDSLITNTLESITLKKMDEEEEKITMEIQQETKKLSELEKEKKKLILEEQERRQKILEEIERQEKREKEEKKRLMKKKYKESLRKKKEDEERLKLIKIEQEKQLKEINELKYKKQLDEQKIQLLAEGKLNKQERKIYRNSIRNEKNKSNVNLNKLPFEIVKDKNKNSFIIKDYNYWDSNENQKYKNYNNELRKNNFKSKIISNNSTGFKSYKNLINYNNKYNLNKEKRIHDDKMTIDKLEKFNEYISFSPTNKHKNNHFSMSPTNNLEKNDKLQTELHQIIPFSRLHNNERNINENIKGKNNNENNDNYLYFYDEKENTKNSYYKKMKNYKNINLHKNIDNPLDININDKKIKFISEKNNIQKDIIIKESSIQNISFTEMKDSRQIKGIASKISKEMGKKMELINRNKYNNQQTKSFQKLNNYLKYNNNLYLDDYNINNNKDIKIKDTKVNKKTINPYNELNNNIIKKEEKNVPKQKSFVEDFSLPSNIKKECLIELNKIDKEKNSKQENGDIQLNIEGVGGKNDKYLNLQTFENLNKKIKKEKKVNILKKDRLDKNKENINYNLGNQKSNYQEFISGTDRNNYND